MQLQAEANARQLQKLIEEQAKLREAFIRVTKQPWPSASSSDCPQHLQEAATEIRINDEQACPETENTDTNSEDEVSSLDKSNKRPRVEEVVPK